MKILLVIIGSLVGLIVLLIFSIWTLGKLYDRWALSAAERYCRENNLDFVEAKVFPNHYGLYFKKNGKRFYANYDFERNRTITWKKGTPLQKVERKSSR